MGKKRSALVYFFEVVVLKMPFLLQNHGIATNVFSHKINKGLYLRLIADACLNLLFSGSSGIIFRL